jgi:hypothetical protein
VTAGKLSCKLFIKWAKVETYNSEIKSMNLSVVEKEVLPPNTLFLFIMIF